MNARPTQPLAARSAGSMTFAEVLIATGFGSMLLTVLMMLLMSSFCNFVGYASLTSQSRKSLDVMLREIRQATQIVGYQTNGATIWLKVANTNAPAMTNTFTWNTNSSVLTWEKTGYPTRTNLTGCDYWTFSFYQRSASNAWAFNTTTTNPSLCKLITMSWKCSLTILGRKINTGQVMTAQVVLRNKQ
jgi:hypothetical protein